MAVPLVRALSSCKGGAVAGWWVGGGVAKGEEEPGGLGKGRRTWREAAERWERPARAERMKLVWAVSSRLGRGEGYRGAERKREDMWPASCFLKLFFIIAVLQYSLYPPSGNFFFSGKNILNLLRNRHNANNAFA